MAFIIHTREKEEEVTIRLLSQLLQARADIPHPDRIGRIAPHFAVKLGKRCIMHIFSFFHWMQVRISTRDIDGRGIIAVGLESSKKATEEALYAQIMLCIGLVAKVGGVAAPTFLHEWIPDPHIVISQQPKNSRWSLVRKVLIRKWKDGIWWYIAM